MVYITTKRENMCKFRELGHGILRVDHDLIYFMIQQIGVKLSLQKHVCII